MSRYLAELVKKTGVTVTPEVAVMQGDRLLYRGGSTIDMSSSDGNDRSRRSDLEACSRCRRQTGRVRETRAVGCILSDLIK